MLISIAVLTYRRPDSLRQLLADLTAQAGDVTSQGHSVEVLVVDNDPVASASEVADERARTGELHIRYVHEPTPGIAAARNRALDETKASDVLVFVDDDEQPSPRWLTTLVDSYVAGLAPVIAGPVRPTYQGDVAEWIRSGPFHDAPSLPTGHLMDHAACGNLLMDRRVIERLGTRFPDLGTRGGEDSWFTAELAARGVEIRWCGEALVTEPVPPDRAEPRWVLSRSFGNGLTWGEMQTLRAMGPGVGGSISRRITVTAGGLARAALGLGTTTHGMLTRNPRRTGLGLHRLARGLGIVGGSWGLVHDEYARDGESRWRLRAHGAPTPPSRA